jgi:hypothetical protein
MVGLVWLLPVLALVGLVLAVLGRSRTAFLQAAVVAGSTVAVVIYVAAEDDYRDTGISRWEAYDAKALTVSAVALGAAAAVGLVAAAALRRRRLRMTAFLASSAAAVLQFMAVLANSLN